MIAQNFGNISFGTFLSTECNMHNLGLSRLTFNLNNIHIVVCVRVLSKQHPRIYIWIILSKQDKILAFHDNISNIACPTIIHTPLIR